MTKSTSPKVFIGMMAYNGERFIEEAIDSLLAQTYPDFTLFISDDASTDRTAEICRRYAEKDARIVYHRQEKNLGMIGNFNFVSTEANLPYFMWASQDDLWDSRFLEICIEDFERRPGVSVVAANTFCIDSSGRTVREMPEFLLLSGTPSIASVSRYVLQPEISGKCNFLYSLFRLEAVRKILEIYPVRLEWGYDYHLGLAAVSHFEVFVDDRTWFKKRYGGFSNPLSNESDTKDVVRKIEYKNPKNHSFPFGRFAAYLRGHLEACAATHYQPLVAFLLFLRLPRTAAIHYREKARSLKKRLQNKLIHVRKERIILQYKNKFNLTTLIETGTYHGEMVQAMLHDFKKIYSIELGTALCERAKEKFKGNEKVTILCGDSGEIIGEILASVSEPCLFWLDAHYSSGETAKGDLETPIIKELGTIISHNRNRVILIDDARLFNGTNDYPELGILRDFVSKQNPDLEFETSADIIRIYPRR